jgi:hypothetical protein
MLAAQGLAGSQDPAAVELLQGALKHADGRVRQSVAASLAGMPASAAAPAWLDALLGTDDDQVALVLANALIQGQWKDGAGRSRLAEKLKAAKGDMRFQVIRLLRQVSGDAMGPETYFDYQKEPDAWVRRWSEWAANP